jgi:hypothetical protein
MDVGVAREVVGEAAVVRGLGEVDRASTALQNASSLGVDQLGDGATRSAAGREQQDRPVEAHEIADVGRAPWRRRSRRSRRAKPGDRRRGDRLARSSKSAPSGRRGRPRSCGARRRSRTAAPDRGRAS